MGVFDLKEDIFDKDQSKFNRKFEEQSAGMGFHQMSTTPIVRRVKETKERQKKELIKEVVPESMTSSESESESESSDTEGNLYMEFDSSSEEGIDVQSLTTKSSSKQTNKRPLIMEISSKTFEEKTCS